MLIVSQRGTGPVLCRADKKGTGYFFASICVQPQAEPVGPVEHGTLPAE